MLLAIVFELNYRTESESEQEDDAYNLVDSIAKAVWVFVTLTPYTSSDSNSSLADMVNDDVTIWSRILKLATHDFDSTWSRLNPKSRSQKIWKLSNLESSFFLFWVFNFEDSTLCRITHPGWYSMHALNGCLRMNYEKKGNTADHRSWSLIVRFNWVYNLVLGVLYSLLLRFSMTLLSILYLI